jgi:outer membrane protein OmpA-like peptidoglycan-associated protein
MESLNYEMVPSGENTLLRLNINFVQSKSEIIEDSYAELDKLINLMTVYPGMEIQLEGHTDFRGSASANMRLSEERVVEVKNYLTNQGIASNRIKTRAFGGTVPITRENTEEAKLLNRRVEARILKTE